MTTNQINYMARCIVTADYIHSKEFQEKFAKHVRFIIYEYNINNGKIAKRLGVSASMLSEIVNLKRPIPIRLFLKFAEEFHMFIPRRVTKV